MVNKIVAISGVNHHDLYNMHNYMCDNMVKCLCSTPPGIVGSTALIYLIGFRDNAGLRSAKVLINKCGLLLETLYVTSYNSMPTSPSPFTENDDSNQSLSDSTVLLSM